MSSATPHRDAAQQRLSGLGKRFFNFIEFDEEEELVLEIRKHPFGLIGIYLTGIFVVVAIIGVMLGVTYFLQDDAISELSFLQPALALIGGLIALAALVMTGIGAYLYQSNVIFVTSEKIAQVLYTSIFNRKISQLSIGDVQDVTVSQNGVFARIFHYGTLVIETAGEQQNYTFSFVPNPYESAKSIVGAHESNLKAFGN